MKLPIHIRNEKSRKHTSIFFLRSSFLLIPFSRFKFQAFEDSFLNFPSFIFQFHPFSIFPTSYFLQVFLPLSYHLPFHLPFSQILPFLSFHERLFPFFRSSEPPLSLSSFFLPRLQACFYPPPLLTKEVGLRTRRRSVQNLSLKVLGTTFDLTLLAQ